MTALLSVCLPQSLFGTGSPESFGEDAESVEVGPDAKVNREELKALFADVLTHQDIRRTA